MLDEISESIDLPPDLVGPNDNDIVDSNIKKLSHVN